ncbi:hypothetical protein AURANDRAFT_3803, partial [Aureococcus anophagefferens]
SVASGRISYLLGLIGPCFPVDSACSASLVAAHLASCKQACVAAGGILEAGMYVAFSVAGMLSNHGRCHSFDSRADGYCRAEGCGCVCIFNTSAITDEEIFVMHLGSSCLHNGQSATFTALNGSSQKNLLLRAGPANARFIEAHATGTSLGDPVETSSLADLFKSQSVSITSLKGNLGHMEGTAGVSGLLNLSNMLELRAVAAN